MKTGDIDKEIDEAADGISEILSHAKPSSNPYKRREWLQQYEKEVPVPIDMNVDNEPSTDKAILEQLVTDCAGGMSMLIPFDFRVEQLINIKRNPTPQIETAIWSSIQEAVEALYRSYEKWVCYSRCVDNGVIRRYLY